MGKDRVQGEIGHPVSMDEKRVKGGSVRILIAGEGGGDCEMRWSRLG